MTPVNMLEAKTKLSQLIRLLETKQEERIIIARNGKPVAQLKLIDPKETKPRMGVAHGKRDIPDDIDVYNDEIAKLFGV